MNSTLQGILGTLASILVGGLIAIAGSTGSIAFSGYPLFFLCIAFAFVVQWIVFLPSFIFQTEKYFDLTGSLTYLSVTALALFLGASSIAEGLDARSLLIAVLVFIWAIRLGSFLFQRVHRTGSDGRFDVIKTSFAQFCMTWTLQGLWVSLTLACALAAMTTDAPKPLGVVAWAGALIWLLGFAVEVVADSQKSRFNSEPANAGKFINIGLWRWSRHPNYFGEIMLWAGISIIALPVLSGWQWATLISPFFVAFLLIVISGIPILERRAHKKWGQDPDYQAYKANTHVILLLPPKS
ncbi:MAG: DUF1295 domain-containing protein [Pseudomonadota bacterium]